MKAVTVMILVSIALVRCVPAQTVPSEITDPEQREILGIAIKLTRPSLAYRAVASEKLLGEANYFSERLKLPTVRPITLTNASVWMPGPWFSKSDSADTNLSKANRIRAATFYASGNVTTTNFTFSFGGPDNGLFIMRTKIKNEEESIIELYPELAATPSLIDTNGAYRLATQWLAAVSVNVPEMEKKYKWSCFQWFFWGKAADLPKDHWTYREPTSTNKTLLPVFDVNWGEGTPPPVQVTVLGTTKGLYRFQIGDGRLCHRPPLIITNAVELNTRTDPPIKHLQRPIEPPQTNSVGTGDNHPAPSLPPPFHQRVKRQ